MCLKHHDLSDDDSILCSVHSNRDFAFFVFERT